VSGITSLFIPYAPSRAALGVSESASDRARPIRGDVAAVGLDLACNTIRTARFGVRGSWTTVALREVGVGARRAKPRRPRIFGILDPRLRANNYGRRQDRRRKRTLVPRVQRPRRRRLNDSDYRSSNPTASTGRKKSPAAHATRPITTSTTNSLRRECRRFPTERFAAIVPASGAESRACRRNLSAQAQARSPQQTSLADNTRPLPGRHDPLLGHASLWSSAALSSTRRAARSWCACFAPTGGAHRSCDISMSKDSYSRTSSRHAMPTPL